MRWPPCSEGEIKFYHNEGARPVHEEIEALLEDRETETDACKVLARLKRVACGEDDPVLDDYKCRRRDGEPIYVYPCGKVAVIYAVEDVADSGERIVIALRFCRTKSALVGVNDLEIARNRLHLVRAEG